MRAGICQLCRRKQQNNLEGKFVIRCAPEDTGDGSDDIHESRTLSCTSGCPGCICMSIMSADIHHAVSFLKSEYSLHLPASRNENAAVAWNRDKERTAIPDRLPVGILELVLCSLGSRQLHHCNRCKFSLQQPAKTARRLLKAQLKTAYLLWTRLANSQWTRAWHFPFCLQRARYDHPIRQKVPRENQWN